MNASVSNFPHLLDKNLRFDSPRINRIAARFGQKNGVQPSWNSYAPYLRIWLFKRVASNVRGNGSMKVFATMRFICLTIIAMCVGQSVFAQDLKVVDKLLKVVPGDGAKAYLTFCSEAGLIGHAFIAISIEDPTSKTCTLVEAIGLHPEGSKKNLKSARFAKAKGGLLSDLQKGAFENKGIVARFTVPLTSEEWDIMKIKIGAHAGSGYQLFEKDCVTFCEETAKVLELQVPDRQKLFADLKQRIIDGWKAQGRDAAAIQNYEGFPAVYIQELGRLNGK